MSVTSIGYKICLFPNKSQEKLLFKFSNTCRGIYNTLLAESKRAYREEGIKVSFKNSYTDYKVFKSQSEYSWFKEVPEACGKQVCKDLVDAYKRVFKSGFGFPKFKKKGRSKLSFYQRTDGMHFKYNKVRVSGIGFIRCQKGNYPVEGYCNPRVTYDGKHWYLSFSIQGLFEDPYESYNDGTGVDVGIKEFAVVSNGMVFENYNNKDELRRLESKLKKLQEVVSRKYLVNKKGE
jgi:putative transposase